MTRRGGSKPRIEEPADNAALEIAAALTGFGILLVALAPLAIPMLVLTRSSQRQACCWLRPSRWSPAS